MDELGETLKTWKMWFFIFGKQKNPENPDFPDFHSTLISEYFFTLKKCKKCATLNAECNFFCDFQTLC